MLSSNICRLYQTWLTEASARQPDSLRLNKSRNSWSNSFPVCIRDHIGPLIRSSTLWIHTSRPGHQHYASCEYAEQNSHLRSPPSHVSTFRDHLSEPSLISYI